MASALLKSRDEDVDENAITRRETRRDQAVNSDEKSNRDEPITDSDASDHEPPAGFKEGGYGW